MGVVFRCSSRGRLLLLSCLAPSIISSARTGFCVHFCIGGVERRANIIRTFVFTCLLISWWWHNIHVIFLRASDREPARVCSSTGPCSVVCTTHASPDAPRCTTPDSRLYLQKSQSAPPTLHLVCGINFESNDKLNLRVSTHCCIHNRCSRVKKTSRKSLTPT